VPNIIHSNYIVFKALYDMMYNFPDKEVTVFLTTVSFL